uniref:ShKT domain-containing protein n=1 Tax=Setaria digitata TaxID=48799 RepID=A0A915PI69_9BILA
MFQFVLLSLFVGAISGIATECRDTGISCTKSVCSNFPEFARNNCAKTCGFCSSVSKFENYVYLLELAHDCSLQTSDGTNLEGCYDKDSDCTSDVCRNYPYTAKERCRKFCGLCQDPSSSSGSSQLSSKFSSHRQSSLSNSRINESTTVIRRKSEPNTALCFDKNLDCKKEICRDYPFTAKQRCAKTCGFCDSEGTTSSSSSNIVFGTTPTRRASTRTSNFGDVTRSGSPHHSAKYGGHGASTHFTLVKDKELECTDLDTDCTQKTCKDYPFTAKERCAKTCGFCRKELTGGSNDRRTTSISHKPTGECEDKDPHCSGQSCLDRPYTARTKCAKTCGFCDNGSLIDLESPSADISDDSSVITLSGDIGIVDTTSRPSTVLSGRQSSSRSSVGTPTYVPQRPSIGSRTDSSRRPSSSMQVESSTNKPYLGARVRYPGRTGKSFVLKASSG